MTTHRYFRAGVLALSALLAACKETTVPNLNNPSLESLTETPTASVVNGAATGMLIALRGRVGTEATAMGILGREMFNLDQAEPRNVIAYLQGPIEPGGFVQDLSWGASYRNIRAGMTILEAADKVTTYTAAERKAISGFVKTIMAMELLTQIRIRDTIGIIVELPPNGSSELGPVAGKDAALAKIAAMLDESKTDLQAGGAAFPFSLTSGFTGFNTPATFLRFNRGIKARVDVYRRQWQQALTDLGESFISTSATTSAALQTGVYHVYSAASGDAVNPVFDPTPTRIYVHPSILSGAQLRADGTPDLRLSTKTAIGVSRTSAFASGTHKFINYPTNASSVPILKNEELILLRAEANYQLGNTAAALADINFVRVNSGGLAPLPATFSGDWVGEILYNRTYSLLLEGGHRWVDARRYGRLAQLPKPYGATNNEKIFPWVMFPADECNQRQPAPQPACSQVVGF
jgi:starch-binding outer membrane protein, SusD/RagB family